MFIERALQPALQRLMRRTAQRRPELFRRMGAHKHKRFLIDPVNTPFVFVLKPDPGKKGCKRYYRNNREKFKTRPLFEASHIFYPAPPDDKLTRKNVHGRAIGTLAKIRQNPELLVSIAHTESACHSAKTGDFPGQIGAERAKVNGFRIKNTDTPLGQ